MNKQLLRKIPKMDELLKNTYIVEKLHSTMRPIVVEALRKAVDTYRKDIIEEKINDFSEEDIIDLSLSFIQEKSENRLKRVVNATGVVIHTNLGRSILSKEAVKNVVNVALNYSNLEFDVEKGERGSRYSHVEELLKSITGAEAALAVNNNAAAILLVLDTMAKGKEAIVSRGELVEIGGSFRVPDVMSYSGTILKEIGTTNRTHLYDYEKAINENTAVLLKVHTSNFKIIGFTEEVSLEQIVSLGRQKDIPVIQDIGSGTLIDFSGYGLSYEPTVQESIKKGVDIVTFSGDKLLGGPQAGIIVGKSKYIEEIKKNQLTRALRIDKMTLAALESTLKYYLDEKKAINNIPTLNMLLSSKEEQKRKGLRLKNKLKSVSENFNFKLSEDFSMVGGGSMPSEKIETYVIKVTSSALTANEIEKGLRSNSVPVIVRVSEDAVIIDLRTLIDDDFQIISEAFVKLSDKLKPYGEKK